MVLQKRYMHVIVVALVVVILVAISLIIFVALRDGAGPNGSSSEPVVPVSASRKSKSMFRRNSAVAVIACHGFGPRADGCTRLQDVGAGIFPMGTVPNGSRWAQLVMYPIIYGSYFCSIFLIYYPGVMERWKWTFYLLLAVLVVLLFASLNVATAGFVQLARSSRTLWGASTLPSLVRSLDSTA